MMVSTLSPKELQGLSDHDILVRVHTQMEDVRVFTKDQKEENIRLREEIAKGDRRLHERVDNTHKRLNNWKFVTGGISALTGGIS